MSQWPEGKKLAIAVTFEFDAEMYWYGKSEQSIEVFANLSRGKYGPDEGIYRVLDMLKQHQIQSTFFIPGWVIENYPAQVKLIHEHGHEIAYHGYMHEERRGISREEEVERMDQCEALIEKITGRNPVGHRGPGSIIHPFTLSLLAERGYLYSSNMKDTDSPYFHHFAEKKLLEIPLDDYHDDATYYFFAYSPFTHDNIHAGSFVNECWQLEFDALSLEQDSLQPEGYGNVLVLKCHPQMIGRAGRIRKLGELIGYMKSHGGWITTLEEIARHVYRRTEENL
jgi:peptidoglycan/xylan/chitin deacetylase (PgdA/CDA1 family)